MRFVKPETRRLTLSDGSWVLVHARLNVGQERALFSRQYTHREDGKPVLKVQQAGLAMVVAYLVDWSAPDFDIRGKSIDEVEGAVCALEPEDFEELRLAIERHELDMGEAREREKKTARTGATALPAISPSLDDAAGATSGSPTLTLMSTRS